MVSEDASPSEFRSNVHYNRAVWLDILVYHYRREDSGCGCGWAELGRSWPEHLVSVYEESMLARERPTHDVVHLAQREADHWLKSLAECPFLCIVLDGDRVRLYEKDMPPEALEDLLTSLERTIPEH